MSPQTCYLVDGSGYIFRAFYAVAPLTTKSGFPTNALFGFVKMLVKLLRDFAPQEIAVVFDAGRKTFRNDLYEDYKANRSECPPELAEQMPYFKEFVEAFGLCLLELPGFEADDLIATLTDRLTKEGKKVTIITADKDLMQLVNKDVMLVDTMRGKEVREPEVFEKFGVTPDKVVEVLALIGDDSDNIPGISGVGPKTAAQLIQKYGDVENVIALVDEIESDSSIRGRAKIAATIREEVDKLRLSRKLVEVDRNVPIPIKGSEDKTIQALSSDEILEVIKKGEPTEKLTELVHRFEFETLVDAPLLKKSLTSSSSLSVEIINKSTFDSFAKEILSQPIFAFDFETTSLDVKIAEIVGASFSWGEDKTFYIPIRHAGDDFISEATLLDFLNKLFSDSSKTAVAHNLKYDFGILAKHQIPFLTKSGDTMIAAYLLNPDERSFSLESLAEKLLHRSSISYSSIVQEGEDFSSVPVREAASYAGEDAFYCFALYQLLFPEIAKKDLLKVYEEIEIPLIPVISQMERNGITLDLEHLAALNDEFTKELDSLRERIFNLAGGEFNMNSPKQLADVLFTKLNLPTKGLKKTKTGISTDSSVLEQLALIHPLPSEILRHRTLFKLKSTYIEALPHSVSKLTSRVHTSFHQTGTATGRLSSSDPNLQNIPIQTKEGRRIREAFVAPKGSVLISADYSQIELRILAHMSDDATLIHAFQQKIDIHAQTAREILGIPPLVSVTSDQRRVGKTMNFGIIYGMSGFRLARELGISVGEGQRYIDSYFEKYPGVKVLFQKLYTDAEKLGEVSTMFGRKRILSAIEGSDRDKGFINRVATNAPIQGSAADIVKLAMIKVQNAINAGTIKAKLLLQIHDELVLEAEEVNAKTVSEQVREILSSIVELKVPLVVDVGIGQNWETAHS